MATIRVFKDYLKDKPEVHHTGAVNLLEWLSKSNYGFIGQQGAVVQVNGQVIADSSKHEDMAERTNIELGLFDSVDVIARPHGVDPVTALIVAGVALAASVVAISLAPTPNVPNDLGKRSESPNNQLNASTNAFRPRQAIPNISGQVVSYPDFVQNSYYIYENNLKKFVEVFCVGEGYHTVEEVKDGETLFDDITGSTYTVYQPNETLPQLADVRVSNNVDGQEIIPPDSPEITATISGGDFFSASNEISTGGTNLIDEIQLEVGDSIEVDLDYTVTGTGTQNFSGIFEVLAISSGGTLIEIDGTVPNDAELGSVSGTILNRDAGRVENWQVLAGDAITEVRYFVIMPQGIRAEDGTSLTIDFTLRVEELDANGDPTGIVTTQSESISGKTLDPQYRTFYVTGLTPSRYRAQIIRQTPVQPEGAQDLVKWERLESVTYYTPNFGEVTTIITNRRATTQPTSGRQSKTNALVTRELPIFDPATGTFGARAPTRSFAQYVMYLHNTVAGIPLDNIAYKELFAIEDSLSDPQLGYFDFTFDSSDVSLQQRIESACNAARVKTYMVGNVRRFVREEAKQVVEAQFTRRNVAPDSAAQRFNTFRDNDFDSVELKYVDPVTNSEAYVRRRIASDGSIEEGLGTRVRDLEPAGVRNELQATDRANLEIRRLRYQRYSMRDTALMDALNVGVGSRIRWADINDAEVFHGEVLAQSGAVFTTSEKFTPEAGKTYYVYLTNDDGSVTDSVVATARADGNEFGFEATSITAYIADGYERQMGSTYIIATDTQLTDFILTRRGRPNERGEVEIEASVYNELMFEKDGQLGV